VEKISHGEVQALLKQAGAAIRDLVQNSATLQEKVAFYESEDRIRGIAQSMEEKNLSADLSFEEKLAALRTAKNIEATEEAVKMASPQGFHIGNAAEGPSVSDGDSRAALEMFITSGDSPE